MAATTTQLGDTLGAGGASIPRFLGGRTRKVTLVSFNISAYTTNGEVLPTAASLGLSEISAVIPVQSSSVATTYMFNWDQANGKLIVNTATGAQAASSAAVGNVILLVIGY
jgi:hypothetical protein